MSPNISAFYPTSLCFDDKRKIKFLSNWFDSKYSNIYVSFDECKPKEGRTCKSPQEIDIWMKQTIFYVISQKTIVSKDKFVDDADHHFTDEQGYHPLEKQTQSLYYSAMQTYGENIIPTFEIFFGVDKVTFDDSKY